MVSTRIAVKPIDTGQNDIRNMFNGKNDQDKHQDSDQMVENQEKNSQNQKVCTTKLTLLSNKSTNKNVTKEKDSKGKSCLRIGETEEENEKMGEKSEIFRCRRDD